MLFFIIIIIICFFFKKKKKKDPLATCFPFFPVPLNELNWSEISCASIQIMQFVFDELQRLHVQDVERRRLLLLSAFCAPLWGYLCSNNKKREHRGLPFFILREWLCFTVGTGEAVMHLLGAAHSLHSISRRWLALLLDQIDAERDMEEHDRHRLRSQDHWAGPDMCCDDSAQAAATAAAAFASISMATASIDGGVAHPAVSSSATATSAAAGTAAAATAAAAALGFAEAATIAQEEARITDVARKSAKPALKGVFAGRYVAQEQHHHSHTLRFVPDDVRLELGRALRMAGNLWHEALTLADVFARHFHAFVIERYLPSSLLLPWLQNSQLLGCWEWRPLFDGHQLAALGVDVSCF